MSRIVIFSTGVIRERLIGPEIRLWEFAKNLCKKGHEVTLAVPNSDFSSNMPFEIVQYTNEKFKRLTKGKDVAITQGDVYNDFIKFSERIPTVCDLYDPYVIECLHMNPMSFPSAVRTLKTQLLTGDFFLCASEAQRLFYLGMFAVLGRLNHSQFSEDSEFENLIDVVPFGTSMGNSSFKKDKSVKKDIVVFLGGVYNWYNPFTCLDCLKIILRKRKDISFLLIKFPFYIDAVKNMEREVLDYAAKIGVKNHIIFGEWVPYEERSELYSAIDIALVIHKATLEATLSFRTRILDFLSFGIPVIANEGGSLEDMIKSYECGITVKESSPEDLADTIISLVENQQKMEEIISRGKLLVKDKFLWEKVMEPLERFCKNPSFYSIPCDNTSVLDVDNGSIIYKSTKSWKTYGFKHFSKKILDIALGKLKRSG